MRFNTILYVALLCCLPTLSILAQTTATPTPTATPAAPALATVMTRDDASKQVGNVAIIKGKYAAFTIKNVKGMKRCAKIVLGDNSQIFIETGKKAKRKKKEYQQSLDKNVIVTGKIAEKIPLDIKGSPRIVGSFVVSDVKIEIDKEVKK